jgi:hypothetical protein
MLGWRKLGAWLLVFIFVVYMSAFVKLEIPKNNMELVMWVTGFFFGTNAVVHTARAVGEALKKPGA